jgi:hypothetical protein
MHLMIAVALLAAVVQPLPAHAHRLRPVERVVRAATPNAPPRVGTRLRDLRLAVRSLDPAELDRTGPSGL